MIMEQKLRSAEASASDYEDNMFSDGQNRTATDERVRKAPGYDRAAHKPDHIANPVAVETPVQNRSISDESSGNISTNEGIARGTKDPDRTRPVDVDPQEN